jgi:tripartite-type tricarboxylate transporter receptor subunit TctC
LDGSDRVNSVKEMQKEIDMGKTSRFYRLTLLSTLAVFGPWSPLLSAVSLAQAPFYQGKTITIVQGRGPGGSGDMRARAITQFLPKYIPGNPTIVHEFMAGGGGLKAANHIYSSVKGDGLTIGSVSSGLISSAVLGNLGVKYQIEKFHYLGAADAGGHYIFYTRKELGVTNVEKLRATSGIRIGAQSVGHSNYNIARLLAYLIPLKDPRFVTGYASPEIDAAILRGELDSRFNQSFSVVQNNPEWVEKKLMDFHVTLEIIKGDKNPKFAHVPELESFTKTQKDKQLVNLQRSFRLTGSPLILPPATPADRVALLQQAMTKVFKDPEFPKYFKKTVGDDPEIVLPEVMDKAVKELERPPEVVELLKKLAGPDPLPAR